MESARPSKEPLVRPGEIDHHVADMSATFSADVTLSQAQSKLREHGQWLPVDGDVNATLGSLVERNSTGPLRLGFGAWRDVLLGAQFTNGAGELISAGGRTVKNVAGYDLTKFMVGQYGVFGKVVTLTTRAYKAPARALLAKFEPDVKKLNQMLVTPCRPQWAMLRKDALVCGYLGDEATVNFYEQQVPQYGTTQVTRQSLDEDIAARGELWRSRNFRASVPPARLPEFVAEIGTTDWSADAAFGIVIGACASGAQATLQKAAERVGGSVIFFDENDKPQNLKLDPGVAALMERLKSAFDPNEKLNPLPLSAS